MKRRIRELVTRDGIAPRFRRFVRSSGAVFTMHRFSDPETGVRGHDPEALRARLAYLRRHRYDIVPLNELVRRMTRGKVANRGAVAFTVDDGYADFHRVAAPIFAEFDCPVTVFVVTGFVDGNAWLWWDRVAYAFEHSDRRKVTVEFARCRRTFRWHDRAGRGQVSAHLVEALKRIPDAERLSILDSLPERLGVTIPLRPTAAYAPMTWDQVRADGQRGVSFGPHTVTHPILSRVGEAKAKREIAESTHCLRRETDAFVPIFSFPNGQRRDITRRDLRLVRGTGLEAACTTRPAYLDVGKAAVDGRGGRFLVPRFSFDDDHSRFVQTVSGIERFKMILRGAYQRSGLARTQPPFRSA